MLLHREESVFYVVHYIKWFDAERLTFTIDEVWHELVVCIPEIITMLDQ